MVVSMASRPPSQALKRRPVNTATTAQSRKMRGVPSWGMSLGTALVSTSSTTSSRMGM